MNIFHFKGARVSRVRGGAGKREARLTHYGSVLLRQSSFSTTFSGETLALLFTLSPENSRSFTRE